MSVNKKEKPFERNPGLKHNKAVGYPIGDYGNLSKQRNMDRHLAATPQPIETEFEIAQVIASRVSINVIPGETPSDDESRSMRLAVTVYRNDSKGLAGECPDLEVIHEAVDLQGLSSNEKANIINYCIECFSANAVGNPDDLPAAPATGDFVLIKPPADNAPDDICIYHRIDDPGKYSVASGGSKGPSPSQAKWPSSTPVVAETYPPAARSSLAALATKAVTEGTMTDLPCIGKLPDIAHYSAAGGKQPVFPVGAYRIGRAMDNHGGNAVDWPTSYIRPVVAILDGTITKIKSGSPKGTCGGQVNVSYTVNGKTLSVVHCHLSTIPNDDEEGKAIKRGDVIGLSGGEPGTAGAGRTSGQHLHTSFNINGTNATNQDIKDLLGWDLLAANNSSTNTPVQAYASCREKS